MSVTDLGAAAFQATSDLGQIAARYLPEPLSQPVGMFGRLFGSLKSLVDDTAGGVPTSTYAAHDLGNFEELIQLQIETQERMAAVSMISNIEKSKHETKMAAIRNVRVG